MGERCDEEGERANRTFVQAERILRSDMEGNRKMGSCREFRKRLRPMQLAKSDVGLKRLR